MGQMVLSDCRGKPLIAAADRCTNLKRLYVDKKRNLTKKDERCSARYLVG